MAHTTQTGGLGQRIGSTIVYSQHGQSKVRVNGTSGVNAQVARLSHALETSSQFWERFGIAE